jgi:hypothetical protein
MAFEEFNAKGGKFKPQIIINKYGGFTLSSGMHHRYGLDKYLGVKLYFDSENKKVGVKLLEKEDGGMFRLKKSDNEKGAFFSARSFFGAYNLEPKKVFGRYDPEEAEVSNFGKMFVITLKEKEIK